MNSLINEVPVYTLGLRLSITYRIIIYFLLPPIASTIIYLIVITSDIGLFVQYILEGNPRWAALTAIFMFTPSLVTFIFTVSVPDLWPSEKPLAKENLIFLGKQLWFLIGFPFAASYRIIHEIFWSVEAICANLYSDEERREGALKFLLKPRPMEMYFFLQAYLHSAPQILLQFHILLNSVIENRDTAYLQLLSISVSLLRMAITTMRYQRFERRKVLGVGYPWSSSTFDRISRIYSDASGSGLFEDKEEKIINKNDPEISPLDYWLQNNIMTESGKNSSQDSDTIYENDSLETFEEPITTSTSAAPNNSGSFTETKNSTSDRVVFAINDVLINKFGVAEDNTNDFDIIENDYGDDDVFEEPNTVAPINIVENNDKANRNSKEFGYRKRVSIVENPDVEKRRSLRLTESRRKKITDMSQHITPPHTPAPRPTSLVAIKDRIMSNAELITDKIPQRRYKDHDDFDLPVRVRKNVIKGIEEEDGVSKLVAFIAWFLFIMSRMLALATFSSFYLKECFFICLSHYIFMVLLILWNSWGEHLNRKAFYLFLGYVYVFCLIEMKMRFKKVRIWYGIYFMVVLIQNLALTAIWYWKGSWASFWYSYIAVVIIGSAALSHACFIIYLLILKPKVKVLYPVDSSLSLFDATI